MQLFCLPYSGASAMVYARWRRELPSWIDAHPLEWPGRGARMDEPLARDPIRLAEQLAREIGPRVQSPYAVFGHSLGALVAFELVHGLIDQGVRPPAVLIVSGAEAPAVRDGSRWRRPLSDDELLRELRDLRGTPEEAISNQELMRSALPVLRADFLMCGAYVYRPSRRLPCPIHVLGGDEDAASRESLEAWALETSAGCEMDILTGHHFFIHTQQAETLQAIVAAISRYGLRNESDPTSQMSSWKLQKPLAGGGEANRMQLSKMESGS